MARKLPGFLKDYELQRDLVNNVPKKKILMIPSWYPDKENRITGCFFREQALLLSEEYDVRVLAGKPIYFSRLPFLKKILTFRLKTFSFMTDYFQAPPEVTGFQFAIFIFLSQKQKYYQSLRSYRRAFKQMIRNGWKPDLIHAHSIFNAGLIAFALQKEYGIPSVLTEHNLFLLHKKSGFIIKKVFEALTGMKQVLTVSTDKMRQILMHYVDCNPIVVGNYVNENIFLPATEKSDRNKKFKILIVAAYDWIKDYNTFFRMIKELKGITMQSFTVEVIGSSVWSEKADARIIDLARSYGVSDLCEFYSLIERSEIPRRIQSADVLVLTSIAEGLPVSALEALACGVPVFATACGGLEDIIHEKNGRLVKIRDYKELAVQINEYIDGRITFDPLIIREDIVNKFGSKAFLNTHKKIYSKLMQ